jgi:hypothetical protein
VNVPSRVVMQYIFGTHTSTVIEPSLPFHTDAIRSNLINLH